MRAAFCAMIASATVAAAEVPSAKDPEATFDVIFNLPEVQSIALDPAGEFLYAAVSPVGASGEGSVIVSWQLDPIRLDRTWPNGTLVSDLAVGPSGLIYAAGQKGSGTENAQKGKALQSRSGSVINVDPNNAATSVAEVISHAEGFIAVSRFNQVAFGEKGEVYIASPTQFGVSVLRDSQDGTPNGTTLPQFVLTCGAPAQLSVFELGGQTGYAASTTDGALLEVGPVGTTTDGTAPTCFRVTNVFGYAEAPSALNSVVHAVLTDGAGRPDAILALEPNTGTLHLLRVDAGARQLARADRIEIAEKGEVVGGVYSQLAASADGSVIFVGGKGRDTIVRFRREGDRLKRVGSLLLVNGLRSIDIDAEAARAAIVLQAGDGLDRIHIVRNPGSLGDGRQRLPGGGSTLQQVQADLTELGFRPGPADGMLGPLTLTAIDQLLESELFGESRGKEIIMMVNGILFSSHTR